MKAKIKICGITNLTDARLALELGADVLGFNFYRPSPRYIDPAEAARIIDSLPAAAAVSTSGIFVQAGVAGVKQVLQICPLDIVQLHSDETADECEQIAALGVGIIKAFRVKQPADVEQAREYTVDYILLDAFREDLYGGTGRRFDWSWVTRSSGRRQKIFLAGGISPDNITQALAVGTYGVDLCSGVETRPGVKDPAKMKKLFAEITRYYERQ